MKESIKKILNSGASIKVSYKTEISSWYSDLEIYKVDGDYYVRPECFSDIDEAINYFLDKGYSSKNVGYIQNRLSDKGYNFEEDYDLEKPDKELIKLFKEEGKLVDEEFKLMNVIVKPFPKTKDAVNEFKTIIDEYDVKIFKYKLIEFDKKYKTLNPFITISFKYIKTNGNDYRCSIGFKDFSESICNKYKSLEVKDYQYEHIEVCIKLDKTDYIRYEIKN